MNLFSESVFVGMAIMIIGALVTWVLEYLKNGIVDEYFPPHFKAMQFALFVTGVAAHLVFEMSGMNEFYVKYKAGTVSSWTEFRNLN